jgi:hypothetical protein
LFAEWQTTFYGWKENGARMPPADWEAVLAGAPIEVQRGEAIDFRWGGGAPSKIVPADYFATVSTAEIELPAGQYVLRTVSDDGVRVSIDGKRAIDNWTWHPPQEDKAEIVLGAGRHAVQIEHFEIDGVSQLQFWIEPK